MIYLAECTALAAIFSNFKRMVSIRCFRIFADNTSRLNQLNMLYARACTWTLFAFTIRLWLLTAAKSKPDLLSLMKISSCSRHNNDPSFCSVYSISDSLRNVSWSVLNYDTIIFSLSTLLGEPFYTLIIKDPANACQPRKSLLFVDLRGFTL